MASVGPTVRGVVLVLVTQKINSSESDENDTWSTECLLSLLLSMALGTFRWHWVEAYCHSYLKILLEDVILYVPGVILLNVYAVMHWVTSLMVGAVSDFTG